MSNDFDLDFAIDNEASDTVLVPKGVRFCPPEGSPKADIWLIGEAPEREEI
jgi:uracil-DNA glycosylase